MGRALELAAEGAHNAEIPVGALVVDAQGRIVGEAWNSPCGMSDPTAHAEILALREAGRTVGNCRLVGCVCVVTLEPCPMCAAALVHARVDGVVFGAADPRAGAVISCAEYLDVPFANHRVWHMGGIRARECGDMLLRFFRERR
jgi:tRNA(adenine34) deaminase